MTHLVDRAAGTRRATGPRQAIPLLAASCMPVMGSVLITPVLPQLSDHFAGTAGSLVLVPMIVAVPALMIAIFAPLAGQIADRFARKSLLFFALVAYAIVGVAPVVMDDLRNILISRVLVGLCEAAIMTVATALIVDYFPDERRRNRYLGLQAVVTTLAATVFIALGGALGGNDWHTPFWVYALALVVALPVAVFLWEPETEEAEQVAKAPVTPMAWGRLALPLGVTLFGGMSFYVLTVEVSYLVVDTGVASTATRTIGAVAALAALATAAGGLSFGRLARFTPARLLPAAFGLQALGMLIVWIAPGLGGVVAGAVIASLGSGVLLPTMVVWVVAERPFDERGRVSGLWNSAFFFGQFLTPLVIGGLTAAVGGLSGAVGIVGVFTAGMAVFTRLVVGRGRGRGQARAVAA